MLTNGAVCGTITPKGVITMKKLLSLIMCIPTLLGLASCGNSAKLKEIMQIADPYDLVIELSGYICEKCDYGDNMKALSEPERVFYVTQELLMEVNNGGFSQYYFNSSGDLAGEVVSAFEAIGAQKTADICRRANESFGCEIPTDRQKRWDMLDEYQTEEVNDILYECEDEFFSLDEDVSMLAYEYVMAHRDDFK